MNYKLSINLKILIIKLFFIFVVIDFSGDLLLQQGAALSFYKKLEELIRYSIIVLLILISILGCFNLIYLNKNSFLGLAILSVTISILLYSFLLGLYNNIIVNAIREFLPFASLFLIPLFNRLDKTSFHNLALFFIYSLVIVSSLKILIIQFLTFTIYGVLSWKILLRLSPLLILPYCYFLLEILKKQVNRINLFFMFITTVSILIANARALNILLLLSTILISLLKINVKIFNVFIIIFISALFSNFATDGEFQNVFGIWTGDHLINTVDYRKIQLDVLFNRILDKPIFGFGLGYFTPGYNDYAYYSLPYLLELDLINFFTKIGVPLSILYIFTYLFFIFQFNKNKVKDSSLALSFLLALILLLIYSLFQTCHSSFSFWMYYAFTFTFIFRKY
jgi:hypothetical protein